MNDKKTYRTFLVLQILILLVFCISCTTNTGNATENKIEPIQEIKKIVEQKIEIKYHLDSLKTKDDFARFTTKYDSAQRRTIAAINRLTPNRLRFGIKQLVVPDTILSDFSKYSVFPETFEMPDSITKLILINLRVQLFAVYENGKQIKFGPISSGRKAKPTPTGLFYTNYKKKLKTSTVNGEWKMPWYFNIANRDGIGMHEYVLPGYPASHSCIRMYKEDAMWIFNWADQWRISADETTVVKHGTPVILFGTYDFSKPVPWLNLPANPKELELTAAEIATVNSEISKIKK